MPTAGTDGGAAGRIADLSQRDGTQMEHRGGSCTSPMNSECFRIADQLRRAFAGDPWHGSPLCGLLAGIEADQARAHPIPEAHSVWELVLHIDAWVNAAGDAARGAPMPKMVGTERDWLRIEDDSAAA